MEEYTSILYREVRLPSERHMAFIKLDRKSFLVNRFKKSWPQDSVHVHRCANNRSSLGVLPVQR